MCIAYQALKVYITHAHVYTTVYVNTLPKVLGLGYFKRTALFYS